MINQGDIFWIDLGSREGSGPAYLHPHLVIQNNIFNQSRINTVVVCTLASNTKRANSPGNVLLEQGEANLPKSSVVNVTQLFTVDKSDLVEKIGTVSRQRFLQVLDGIGLVINPTELG